MTKTTIYNTIKTALEDNNYIKLYNLLNELENDIKTEVIKSKGGKTSDLSIIKFILKNSTRKDINGYSNFVFNNQNYYGFLDGYHAVCSSYNYEQTESENSFNFNNIFNNKCFESEQIKINLTDLKAYLKLNPFKKNKDSKPYIINTKKFDIGFNAKYLYNVLTFCNADTIFIQDSNLKPVFIKSDDFNKIGLVMPMRIKRGETND